MRGLPIGREALQPLEPRHSSNKATPIYYTKNESLAIGISKMWCVCQLLPLAGYLLGRGGAPPTWSRR
jgi:hypothetical protein